MTSFSIDYVFNSADQTSLTLSSPYSKAPIVSFHSNIYNMANTQHVTAFMEPRTSSKQKSTSLHFFFNNHDFILPSIPIKKTILCKSPTNHQKQSEVHIEQITPPENSEKVVTFLTKYQQKFSYESAGPSISFVDFFLHFYLCGFLYN